MREIVPQRQMPGPAGPAVQRNVPSEDSLSGMVDSDVITPKKVSSKVYLSGFSTKQGEEAGQGMAGKQKRKAALKDGQTIRYTTLKVRLYPTPAQKELFDKTFGCCRWIWNHMLADQQRFYAETDAHFIPTPAKYKKEAALLTEVDNQALIQEYIKLAQAFRVFFKDPGHFHPPKFKRRKDDKDSYTVCNCHNSSGCTIYTTESAVRFTKAGAVAAHFHRRPQSGWELTRATVSRTRTGKYHASLLYPCPVRAPEPVVPTADTTLGLKLSLRHFYVTDTGLRADPPRWIGRAQDKLAKLQRELSRMQPGSKNYEAQVRRYRLLHENIANQRRGFIHKETRRIANAWDAVCVRNDQLRDLAQSPQNAPLPSLGFGMFRTCLAYKLERLGKPLILVDRYAPTSRICHSCGCLRPDPVDRRRRIWTCPDCGAVQDREINAEINIKTLGLAQLSS